MGMDRIFPKISPRNLEKGARRTAAGGQRVPLPGVKARVLHNQTAAVHRQDYQANGDLAEKISAAVRDLKMGDERGPWWVVGWRMYPNGDHPHWSEHTHACGCGCGCSSHPVEGKRSRKAASPKKRRS